MDDDLDLKNFSNQVRLFPLPGVVLFPHAILPLHIFEPRYRQMTADALSDDKLVAIVQHRILKTSTSYALGSPPIEDVACVGRIIQHESLADGRYNFLLLGCKRIHLTREIASDKLYRIAKAELIEDFDDDSTPENERAELITLFRIVFERLHRLDADMAALLENTIPLALLTDIIGHALGLPPEIKQHLLAEPSVSARANSLLKILRHLHQYESSPPAQPQRPFPPSFSAN